MDTLIKTKTYVTEIFLALVAFILLAPMAFAGDPINDPRAEIFRAAGCEFPEYLQPVLAKDGETILYWQNTSGKGCKADVGRGPDGNDEDDEGEEIVAELPDVLTAEPAVH